MSRQRSSIVHEFYCTQCGERGIPVYRKYGQFRKVGHLKKLYCLSCGKETNHAECISASKYDSNMFFEEYKSGKLYQSIIATVPNALAHICVPLNKVFIHSEFFQLSVFRFRFLPLFPIDCPYSMA